LRRSLAWLAIALAVSLLGAFEGSHLMGSLNDPIPGVLEALRAHADPPAAHAPAPQRRVVVVLIDGLGGDAFEERLREGTLGDVAWRASLDSGVPSRSRPVYHAMLTGVPAWASGIRGNTYARGRADSVAERVRAGGGRVAWMLEGVPWYCELFCGEGDVTVVGPSVTSPETFARVWDASPDLLVVHLTDVDEAGHLHGAASEEYLDASRRAMATVAAFRAIARSRPGGDGALWLVGADHGHTAYGGHGGVEPEVRRVAWVALFDRAAGADSGAREVEPMTPVTALAPTIARVLGVDAPRESMVDGLPLLPSSFGAPLRASSERILAVEAARAQSDARTLGNPSSRATLIVGGLVATFVALVGLRRRRGLAETGVFVIAVAGFLIAGPGLSMSAVRTEGYYLARGLITLALFAAAAWVIARRWGSAHVVAAVCVVFPVLALVAMHGSLGQSDVTPLESVLWPSLGLVPPSVCTAIAVVECALLARGRRNDRGGHGQAEQHDGDGRGA
jgi:Type I phosphodiesterase / nucleotide pyrophosphatase